MCQNISVSLKLNRTRLAIVYCHNNDQKISACNFRIINWTIFALLAFLYDLIAGEYHFVETSHMYCSETLKQKVVIFSI